MSDPLKSNRYQCTAKLPRKKSGLTGLRCDFFFFVTEEVIFVALPFFTNRGQNASARRRCKFNRDGLVAVAILIEIDQIKQGHPPLTKHRNKRKSSSINKTRSNNNHENPCVTPSSLLLRTKNATYTHDQNPIHARLIFQPTPPPFVTVRPNETTIERHSTDRLGCSPDAARA